MHYPWLFCPQFVLLSNLAQSYSVQSTFTFTLFQPGLPHVPTLLGLTLFVRLCSGLFLQFFALNHWFTFFEQGLEADLFGENFFWFSRFNLVLVGLGLCCCSFILFSRIQDNLGKRTFLTFLLLRLGTFNKFTLLPWTTARKLLLRLMAADFFLCFGRASYVRVDVEMASLGIFAQFFSDQVDVAEVCVCG